MDSLTLISEFIGRFHPLVVHLPIGMLLLAIVFYSLSFQTKFEMLKPAVKLSLLIGSASAALSCISGFLLSRSGDYDELLVNRHQWFGVALFIVSATSYFIISKNSLYLKIAMPVLALLIITTGHMGGTLTHGEDYLTNAVSVNNKSNTDIIKPIANVQQAVVYTDIIQPILKSKCYSCHGPNKQKGKLRLDDPSFILKGGEHEKAVVFGDVAQSEMIERIFLPKGNKEHMPPSQKPQLSNQQIELINWWISSNAGFDKKVAEVSQSEKIKLHLASLSNNSTVILLEESLLPEKKTDKAPDSILQQLRLLNVSVNPVAQNSNYLTVNFIAVDSVTLQHLQLIQKIQQQILWLKLSNVKMSDSVFSAIGQLKSLTRLYLNHTNTSDEGLHYLNNLSQLQYLNLSGTNVTFKGVEQLKGLKKIQQLYLYQTQINADQYISLKTIFPNAVIDSGGYKVNQLSTDTIIVKPKK